MAKIDEGTLCHEIFSRIRKADQLDAVLDECMSSGLIASEEQRDKLKSLISSAWNGNEAMQDWFTAPWELRLEEAIFIGRKEIRPDRVMINPITNEAIVLDYKFGEQMAKHRRQVRDYMAALRGIGYSPVRGYLWYAQTNTLKEVN